MYYYFYVRINWKLLVNGEETIPPPTLGEACLRSSVRDLSPAGGVGALFPAGGVQRFSHSYPFPSPFNGYYGFFLSCPWGGFSFLLSSAGLIQTVSSYKCLFYVQPRHRFMSAIRCVVKSNWQKGKIKRRSQDFFMCLEWICSSRQTLQRTSRCCSQMSFTHTDDPVWYTQALFQNTVHAKQAVFYLPNATFVGRLLFSKVSVCASTLSPYS